MIKYFCEGKGDFIVKIVVTGGAGFIGFNMVDGRSY
jgi:nucleoside-diphosphate-sugar epimerase